MVREFDKCLSDLSEFELERIAYYSGERYADFNEEGNYKCANCAQPVYSSKEKFEPNSPLNEFVAFRSAINDSSISKEEKMNFLGINETEIKCGKCSFHLGFLYYDGKEVGDNHPDAKERHCLSSLCINFESTNGEPGKATFTREPIDVFNHLEEQEENAKNIVTSGSSVELKPVNQSQANEEKQEKPEQEKPKPEKTQKNMSTPPLQRQDTPAIPRNAPAQREPPKKPTQTARRASQPRSETKTASVDKNADVKKPKTISTSSLMPNTDLRFLIPVSLIITSGIIFYYVFKNNENNK